MAPKELKTLRLLMDNVAGLYGSEFVSLSNGTLSRGTIYTLLERLVDKGYVSETVEKPTQALQLARTRHKITGAGVRAVENFVREMNLAFPSPSGAIS